MNVVLLEAKDGGKKHSVVDYVFNYDLAHLYEYHIKVMGEMSYRGYKVDAHWYNRKYRGKTLQYLTTLMSIGTYICHFGELIYPEHDDKYLRECLLNLKSKGAELVNGRTIDEMLIGMDLKVVG